MRHGLYVAAAVLVLGCGSATDSPLAPEPSSTLAAAAASSSRFVEAITRQVPACNGELVHLEGTLTIVSRFNETSQGAFLSEHHLLRVSGYGLETGTPYTYTWQKTLVSRLMTNDAATYVELIKGRVAGRGPAPDLRFTVGLIYTTTPHGSRPVEITFSSTTDC